MTDTVTEKVTRKSKITCSGCRHAAHKGACMNMASDNDCGCTLRDGVELPMQVMPQAVADPLYAQVIGSLERDLETARQRHHEAEQKVRDLSRTHEEVELLRDQIERMRNELEATKTLVSNMSQYTEAMYKIINKVFRS